MVKYNSQLQEFIAGWCGGCTGLVVGYPFDTVKVRLQTQSAFSTVKYKSGMQCFLHILRTESVYGLYKGLASPLLGQAIINAIIFSTQGNVIKYLQPKGTTLPTMKNSFISGSAAGFFQSFICSPLELIKIRLQMQNIGRESQTIFSDTGTPNKLTPWSCVRNILRYEGIIGLCRGLGSTFYREVPSFGVYFSAYDTLCKMELKEGQRIDEASIKMSLFAGGIAGMLTWLVNYPIDVIKSRIQADGTEQGKYKYNGFMDCGRQIYKSEGIIGFKKGLGVTLIRAFPVNAVTFATVMVLLNYMRRNS
ncbi:Mitochondrial basic amino acids transporter-like [Oopsacas minuta]|uniref:Mitochondrial basic amino acids transporter n=1 Tax=Oopsacas minuta TaxID=111878 RepID=A0AAV7KB56_9METZ|nr:Mitochondrial basic amino acids transporter-like [Oopsacas minuta]